MAERRSNIYQYAVIGGPGVNERSAHHRVEFLGKVDDQDAVNIRWLRTNCSDSADPAIRNLICAQIASQIVAEVWPLWQSAAGNNYQLQEVRVREYDQNFGPSVTTALGSATVNQNGARLGPHLPSFVSGLINSRYVDYLLKIRTVRFRLAGVAEADTLGNNYDDNGLSRLGLLAQKFADPFLGGVGHSWSSAMWSTYAKLLPAGVPGGFIRGLVGLNQVYGTDLLTTMRSRKVGVGS